MAMKTYSYVGILYRKILENIRRDYHSRNKLCFHMALQRYKSLLAGLEVEVEYLGVGDSAMWRKGSLIAQAD